MICECSDVSLKVSFIYLHARHHAIGTVMSQSTVFELPSELHDDDRQLVTNALTAMQALDKCSSYKVDVSRPGAGRIVVRGVLRDDVMEVDNEDVNLLVSVSPSRVERVAVVRNPPARFDIIVCLLDHTQRVMVTGLASFVAMKKRRLTDFRDFRDT